MYAIVYPGLGPGPMPGAPGLGPSMDRLMRNSHGKAMPVRFAGLPWQTGKANQLCKSRPEPGNCETAKIDPNDAKSHITPSIGHQWG